ncbi:serine protease inhibitor ecotin [Faecalibacter bovis]|uniref:Serine protease inhibitor ecotin n=1 Tax=Faecalibacter bovis TaxID=2898187 RepID=A0ABX7XG45_9FLAO|nr:serine protease inhibitor ecotin [Faecalibacter bovis]QTV06833.1 serine protease inhibitor ecotin [Faecalibacter bovis]
MKKLLLLNILTFSSITSFAQMKEDIKMFPKPDKDQVQKVIRVEPRDNENDFMIEIMIGKKTMTDSCNNHFLMGKLEENNLEGWGYSYYNFTTDGNIAGTLMGCSDNKSVEKIVYSPSEKVRYNSRLPIVIYTPKGYEVNYRIWSASDKTYNAE